MRKAIVPAITAVFLMTGVSLVGQNGFTKSAKIVFDLKSISLSKGGPEHQSRVYHPGQTVWINMFVSGLQKNKNNAVSFQADLLLVRASDKKVVLDQKNILNQSINAGTIVNPRIKTTFNIDLFQNIGAGGYTVQIIFRDMISRTYNAFQSSFTVVRSN